MYIPYIIIIFFAIIGVSVFILSLIRLFVHSDKDELWVMIPRVDENNAEMQLRRAVEICSRNKGLRPLCVCPRNGAARRICEIFHDRYPYIQIVEKDHLNEML